MTPKQIKHELDRFVIKQDAAKKAQDEADAIHESNI